MGTFPGAPVGRAGVSSHACAAEFVPKAKSPTRFVTGLRMASRHNRKRDPLYGGGCETLALVRRDSNFACCTGFEAFLGARGRFSETNVVRFGWPDEFARSIFGC